MRHVCVVGGGIVGTNVAFQLARRGVRVTLLERHDAMHSETSSRSTECFRAAWADPTMRAFVGRSIELAELASARFGTAISHRGYFFVSRDEQRMRNLARSFSDAGIPLREHTAAAHRRYDPRRRQTGVDLLCGRGLLERAFPARLTRGDDNDVAFAVHMRNGGWFDSAALCDAMVERLESDPVLGATVLRGAVLEGVVAGPGDVALQVRHNGGTPQTLHCDEVVLAVGPELPQWLRTLGIAHADKVVNEVHSHTLFRNASLPLGLPLLYFADAVPGLAWTAQQVRDMAAHLDPRSRAILMGADLPAGLHFRRLPGNVVDCIWTWHAELAATPVFHPAVPAWLPAATLAALAHFLPRDFRADMERIAFKPDGSIAVPAALRTTSGYYTKTPENRPIIGPVAPRVHVAGALSGFGMMAAAAVGELMATRLTGGALPEYASAFLMQRYDDPEYVRAMPSMVSGQL